MPTALDYRTAAGDFRRAAEASGGTETAVWSTSEEHGVGAGLGELVDRAFAAIATTVATVGAGCTAVADECDRRASVCEAYADEMAAWQRREDMWNHANAAWLSSLNDSESTTPHPGHAPSRPQPPFVWVEL